MADAKVKAEYLLPIIRPAKEKSGDQELKNGENGDVQISNGNAVDEKELPIEEPAEKKSKVEGDDATPQVDGENPDSKKKSNKRERKGQNKKRPKPFRFVNEKKLCPTLWDGDVNVKCTFPNCAFMHDIKEYLEAKSSCLEGECPNYKEYGKCTRGLACVFAPSHTDPTTFVNIVNEELWAKNKDDYELNHKQILDKETQAKLRKRRYNFKKVDKMVENVLKDLNSKKKNKQSDNRSSKNNTETNEMEEEDGEKEVDHKGLEDLTVTTTEAEEAVNINTNGSAQTCGALTNEDLIPLKLSEIKKIDWKNKLYLSPLTTVGNLPFRRICVDFGADITCSEMSLCTSIVQGNMHEFALHRRHPCEKIWGVQICANNPWVAAKSVQVLADVGIDYDFVDLNTGCPLDHICNMGAGCGLITRTGKFESILTSLSNVVNSYGKPFTVKMRTGFKVGHNFTHNLIPMVKNTGVSLITLHGRTRDQRYQKCADWDYIGKCVQKADPIPVLGNGDIFSWEEYEEKTKRSNVEGVVIGRGALIKPWLFQEIKEQRHIDMSSKERLELIKRYAYYGLDHWGSDTQGVETTRRFLLEWLSFYHRYIPFGVLESPPVRINERPPRYVGRDDMETLLASHHVDDWIKISEMFLGKVHESFTFLPKHKANSWG